MTHKPTLSHQEAPPRKSMRERRGWVRVTVISNLSPSGASALSGIFYGARCLARKRRLEMNARTARGRSNFKSWPQRNDRAVWYFFTAQLIRVGVTTVNLNSNSHAHTVWRIISRTHDFQVYKYVCVCCNELVIIMYLVVPVYTFCSEFILLQSSVHHFCIFYSSKNRLNDSNVIKFM